MTLVKKECSHDHGDRINTGGGGSPLRACGVSPDSRNDRLQSLQLVLDTTSSLLSQLHIHEGDCLENKENEGR